MKTFKNFDLSQYNSYRIRSRCTLAHFPESERDIIDLFEKRQDYVLIGSGHNIIFSKAFYEQEFIIFNGNYENILLDSNCIQAESGAFMTSLSEFALLHGLSGLEIFRHTEFFRRSSCDECWSKWRRDPRHSGESAIFFIG